MEPNGLIFGQLVDMGNILKITEGICEFFFVIYGT